MNATESRVPSACRDIDSLVAEVADRFTEEAKQGRHPSVEDYAQQHPEIATIIRQVFPALAVLGDISSCGVDHSPTQADGSAVGPSVGILGDFRIIRELGRGGMGVVYEAEQISLGRRVALKVLPFAAMLDRQQLARFKNEARAAATLDHPNIVAIHSVGVERSVHFYAMQLIEGQSLAQVVEQLRQSHLPLPPGEGRGEGALGEGRGEGQVGAASRAALPDNTDLSDSSSARLAGPTADTSPIAHLPTLHAPSSSLPAYASREYFRTIAHLGIQAAEALDHAHQNGILHRDIKPANLLVECSHHTPRDEKCSHLAPRDGASPRHGRGSHHAERDDYTLKLWITDFGLARIEQDAGMTMTGDILGTLRYMSPEQALAKRVVVDHRSDIYSLGITLYELLTLRPAFTGDDRQELLRQIAFEEPRNLRQVNSRIPQDLETIVLKAIEKSPADRYATAQEFANDLHRFVDDRPITARRPNLAGIVRKWSRRHQTAVLTSAVFLLLTTMGLFVGSLMVARERNIAIESRNEAIEAKNEATEHFQIALGAVDQLLTRVAEEELLNTPQTEQLNHTLLADALAYYQKMLQRNSDHPTLRYEAAQAQSRVGEILTQLDRREEAAAAQADAVTRLRQLVQDFPETPHYRLKLAQALSRGGNSLEHLGLMYDASSVEPQAAGRNFDEAIELLENLHRASPDNSEYAVALADVCVLSVRNAGWKASYVVVDDSPAKQITAPETENLPPRNRRVGRPSWPDGKTYLARLFKARTAIERFARSSEANVAQKEAHAHVLSMLGRALAALERIDEAKSTYEESLRTLRDLLKANPSDKGNRESLANTLSYYSDDFLPHDDAELLAARKECADLFEGLVRDYPSIPRYRASWANALNGLAIGFVIIANPDPDIAIEHLAKSGKLLQDLRRDFPRLKDHCDRLEGLFELDAQIRWSHLNDSALEQSSLYRDFLLKQAEALSDNSKLFKATNFEWSTAKELFALDKRDEATKLANDACQHITTYLQEYEPNPHECPPDSLSFVRTLILELHGQGITERSAELKEQLLRLKRPQDLGHAALDLGKYSEAARHYYKAALDNPKDVALSLRAALVLLIVGDRPGYQTICNQMLNYHGDTKDADTARQTAWACLMSSPSVGQSGQILRLNETAMQDAKWRRKVDLRENGLALARGCDWEGLLQWCTDCRAAGQVRYQHSIGILEAIAFHQLGRTRAAKTSYDESIEYINNTFKELAPPRTELNGGARWFADWNNCLYFELLRREAKELIDP